MTSSKTDSPKIVYMAAGAGGMYCGNCLHDNTLAAAMLAQGHDMLLVPTYTPVKTDETNVSLQRVFFGGINIYLKQYSPLFRYLPRFVERWLNSPGLIRWATQYSLSMRADELGALAVSMLKGEEGNQRKELEELVHWLKTEVRPDIIHLSNVMLVGMARRLKAELGVPVLCTLSGEDLFLQQLHEPYTSQAKANLRERSREVDGFVAMNQYYADVMTELLEVDPAKVHVVPHGLNLQGHKPRAESTDALFTIGYLGRISPEKGLEVLADAFIELHRHSDLPPLRLKYAGYLSKAERKYLAAITAKLAAAGLADKFEYAGEVDRHTKIEFLHSLDTFVMPSVHPESKGIPAIEAMANAVPVVVPSHGAFPELIAQTQGGLLCEPKSSSSLAASLQQLIRQPTLAALLGQQGHAGVQTHYRAEQMAQRTVALYDHILAKQRETRAAPSPALS